MKVMTQNELVAKIAATTTCTRAQVTAVLRELARVTLYSAMDGNGAPIPGLGRIVIRPTKARVVRHIHTGEELEIPARWRPVFRPSQALRNMAEHGHRRGESL